MTKTVKIKFVTGYGSHPDVNPILDVTQHAQFLRGDDEYGTCAFCKGDPCNDESEPDSVIARFYAGARRTGLENQPTTCPCCQGRPT